MTSVVAVKYVAPETSKLIPRTHAICFTHISAFLNLTPAKLLGSVTRARVANYIPDGRPDDSLFLRFIIIYIYYKGVILSPCCSYLIISWIILRHVTITTLRPLAHKADVMVLAALEYTCNVKEKHYIL